MSDLSSYSCIHHAHDDYTKLCQCLCRCASRNDMDGFGSRADSCHYRACCTTATTATTSRGRVSIKSPHHDKAGKRIRIEGIMLPSFLVKMIMIVCLMKVHVADGFTLSVKMDFNVNGGGVHYGAGGSSNRIPRAEVAGHVHKRRRRRRRRTMILEMIKMESNHNAQDNDNGDDDDDDWNMMGGDGSGVVLDDLTWRVEKLRLEEQNKRRFLKSGARYLPYAECRKWVQAWGKSYWQTRDDWYNWIAMGEKRNAYIPSRPDEYYSKSGDWISWEHFLIIPPETLSSSKACTNTTDTEYDDEEIQRKNIK